MHKTIKIDRRECERFVVPGAKASYGRKRTYLPGMKFAERNCPVVNLSRGGVRILTDEPLVLNAQVVVRLRLPGIEKPLDFLGKVQWCSTYFGKGYSHQSSIRFNAYGQKKDHNDPLLLRTIIALEQTCFNGDYDI